ncbi:MAG: hypothetical protein MGF17_17230, partial [Trichodesmium sp. MAG_R04]|nr:hypothetical protein [Trichodesmium sp. MAG_R04]
IDCSNVAINFSDDSFCVMSLILQHYLYFFSSYPYLLSGYIRTYSQQPYLAAANGIGPSQITYYLPVCISPDHLGLLYNTAFLIWQPFGMTQK